jgi:cytochrome d ubiquinol oxidase subunit I
VSAGEVWTSLIPLYPLLYAPLAVIEIRLLLRFIAAGAPDFEEPVDPATGMRTPSRLRLLTLFAY